MFRFSSPWHTSHWLLALLLPACAEEEHSAFDPDQDVTPPTLSSFAIVNEAARESPGRFRTWAEWVASEPVRVVVEYGDFATELHRHSYPLTREYAESGRVKLVGAESSKDYAYSVRMWDRSGNEATFVPEDAPATEAQVADELFLLAMIDVGWGDAIYLEAPDGTNVLIDAGHPLDATPVGSFLARRGITELDFASLSHVHEDHIGGFYGDSFTATEGLLTGTNALRVGTFLDIADKTTTNGPFQNLSGALEALEGRGKLGRYALLRWGASSSSTPDLRWGEGVRVDLLSAGRKDYLLPDFIIEAEEGSVINNDSMVYRVQFGNFVAMLMGDGEFTTEQFLQDHHPRELLEATILKLGHHGSNDANSERFLDVVAPQVALVPNAVSENPGVEHPFVLNRLRNRLIDYYASDRVIPNRDRALPGVRGDILVWTDGTGFTIVVENVRFE